MSQASVAAFNNSDLQMFFWHFLKVFPGDYKWYIAELKNITRATTVVFLSFFSLCQLTLELMFKAM